MSEENKEIQQAPASDLLVTNLANLYMCNFQVTLKCKPNLKTNKVEVELVESIKLEDFQ